MPDSSASACGAVLGQELPGVQAGDDRGDPRPVLHRRLRPRRGRGFGAVPAAAFPPGQLVPGHLGANRPQAGDLAALHGGDRAVRQPGAAPAAAGRLMADLPVRPGRLRQCRPLVPVLPAGLAAARLAQRPRLRRWLGQSFTRRRLGGVPRILVQPASSPAIRSRAPASSVRAWASTPAISASSRRSDATSAASTSYGGGSCSPGIPGPCAPPAPALPVSPDARHHCAAHVLELTEPYRKETR